MIGVPWRTLWLFAPALAALALTALALVAAPVTRSAESIAPAGVEDCVADLGQGAAETVSCRVNYRLNPDERSTLVRLTGGALLDAECDLDLDVGRGVMVAALLAPEVLEVPPQDVACRFATVSVPLDVAFLFAPRVWFESGRAVRATPNVHGVRGLPGFLGDVLAQAINRDPQIEAAMVAEVNALLDGMGPR